MASPPVVRTAELVTCTALSPSVRHLLWRTEPSFSWQPGQHVWLFGPGAPELGVPYSVASAPDLSPPGVFEIAAGPGSEPSFMDALREGDVVGVSEPEGSFVRAGDRVERAMLVGAGTGIAPLRAMLQSWSARGAPGTRMTLLFGARREEELLFERELSALAGREPAFRFETTLTRPGQQWRGRRGRVQAHLAELLADLGPAEAYVCGGAEMVEETLTELQRLGMRAERTFSAAY